MHSLWVERCGGSPGEKDPVGGWSRPSTSDSDPCNANRITLHRIHQGASKAELHVQGFDHPASHLGCTC